MKLKTLFFLIIIFSFACGGDQENLNKEFKIQIIKGEITNNLEKIKVNKGENVKFLFSTDSYLTVHLHGYDIEKSISSEETTIMEFKADATGRYRLTAHENMGSFHSSHDLNGEHDEVDDHKENEGHQETLLLILEVYP